MRRCQSFSEVQPLWRSIWAQNSSGSPCLVPGVRNRQHSRRHIQVGARARVLSGHFSRRCLSQIGSSLNIFNYWDLYADKYADFFLTADQVQNMLTVSVMLFQWVWLCSVVFFFPFSLLPSLAPVPAMALICFLLAHGPVLFLALLLLIHFLGMTAHLLGNKQSRKFNSCL